jgi:hypothetical protein
MDPEPFGDAKGAIAGKPAPTGVCVVTWRKIPAPRFAFSETPYINLILA